MVICPRHAEQESEAGSTPLAYSSPEAVQKPGPSESAQHPNISALGRRSLIPPRRPRLRRHRPHRARGAGIGSRIGRPAPIFSPGEFSDPSPGDVPHRGPWVPWTSRGDSDRPLIGRFTNSINWLEETSFDVHGFFESGEGPVPVFRWVSLAGARDCAAGAQNTREKPVENPSEMNEKSRHGVHRRREAASLLRHIGLAKAGVKSGFE
jgi:hypothetical protein